MHYLRCALYDTHVHMVEERSTKHVDGYWDLLHQVVLFCMDFWVSPPGSSSPGTGVSVFRVHVLTNPADLRPRLDAQYTRITVVLSACTSRERSNSGQVEQQNATNTTSNLEYIRTYRCTVCSSSRDEHRNNARAGITIGRGRRW